MTILAAIDKVYSMRTASFFAIIFFFLITTPAMLLADAPILPSLNESDPLFQQIRGDVERAYRPDVPPPPLTLYRYQAGENETIFSIAARLLLPYSSIATLNSITYASQSVGGRLLLIPNQAGLFSQEERSEGASQSLSLESEHLGSRHWYFYPGSDFTPSERRSFFQQQFTFPVTNPRITSPFGFRNSPFTGRRLMHYGIDFGGIENSPILAAAGGEVSNVDWSPLLGFFVEISHDNHLTSMYGHLSQITVSYGQHVRRGEQIGKMGTTGLTTGSHVHFEIHRDGIPVDPALFLPEVRTND